VDGRTRATLILLGAEFEKDDVSQMNTDRPLNRRDFDREKRGVKKRRTRKGRSVASGDTNTSEQLGRHERMKRDSSFVASSACLTIFRENKDRSGGECAVEEKRE